MKYLVMRKDAIKRGGTASMSSSCFPIEVEIDYHRPCEQFAEEIVRKACNQLNQGYHPGEYDYVVVPMVEAVVVSFRKPRPQLEVTVSNY